MHTTIHAVSNVPFTVMVNWRLEREMWCAMANQWLLLLFQRKVDRCVCVCVCVHVHVC